MQLGNNELSTANAHNLLRQLLHCLVVRVHEIRGAGVANEVTFGARDGQLSLVQTDVHPEVGAGHFEHGGGGREPAQGRANSDAEGGQH